MNARAWIMASVLALTPLAAVADPLSPTDKELLTREAREAFVKLSQDLNGEPRFNNCSATACLRARRDDLDQLFTVLSNEGVIRLVHKLAMTLKADVDMACVSSAGTSQTQAGTGPAQAPSPLTASHNEAATDSRNGRPPGGGEPSLWTSVFWGIGALVAGVLAGGASGYILARKALAQAGFW